MKKCFEDLNCKYIQRVLLICSLFALFTGKADAYTFTWKGTGGSTAWELAANWKRTGSGGSSTWPGQSSTTDVVNIGTTTYSGAATQPTLNTTVTIDALTFGGNGSNAITLTINGVTLNATDVTQNHNSGTGGITTTIKDGASAGALTCNTFAVGDGTTPLFLLGTYLTTVNCNLSTLTVSGPSGSFTINDMGDGVLFVSLALNNAQFNLNSGNLTVNDIQTNDFGGYSGTCTFKMDIGSAVNTLTLLGTFPINTSNAFNNVIDFVSGGTLSQSTVIYGATSGTQTVYTTAAATADGIDTSPTMYPNLTFLGAGQKNLAGLASAGAASLTVGGDWTTGGGAVLLDAFATTTTVSVAGNWNNTANVTEGQSPVNITGNLTNNSGGVIAGYSGATTAPTTTITGTLSNSGTITANKENMTFTGAATNTGTYTGGTGTSKFTTGLTNSLTVTEGAGTFTIGNLVNNSPGSFTGYNTATATTSVTGTLSNSGTITVNKENITFTGAATNSDTYTGGTGTSTFNNSFTMTTGTFVASTGAVTFNGTYNNSGGAFTAGGGSVNFKSDYTNSGTFTAGTGTVYFNGTVVQSLKDNSTTGTQFNKVNFNGNALANAKIMSGTGSFAVSPTGLLTMANATTTLDAGGVLTLRSTSSGSAAVDIITSPSVIKGLVNVERFLNGGGTLANRGYRLLSSPVNQTGYATSASNTYGLFYLNTTHTYAGITSLGAYTAGPGGGGNGFSTSNNNATIYLYDETQVYNGGSFTLGNHVPVNAIAGNLTASTETVGAAAGTTIPVGNGFLMYFVGATGRVNATTTILPTDATLTANGYTNQGTFNVKLWTGPSTLSYTTGTSVAHPYPGLNLVGNPYPSTIDLNLVLSQNSTQINSIYVLSARNSPNQAYIAYTANGASAPNQNYAVSGEGFFVTAKGTGNTLTFKESQKIPTSQLTGSALIMSAPGDPAKTLSDKLPALAAAEPQGNALTGLYMKIERDSLTYNYCGIYFRKDWLPTFAEDDAKDLNATTGPVVISGLTSDHIRASVNHMPDYAKGVNVKLYANARTDGLYKLKIEDIRNIDTLYDIYLIDHYKKDSLNIRRYGTYSFNISKADTSSYGGTRFELSVRLRPLPPYRLLNFTAQKVTEGIKVTWQTEAESNYTGFVLQKQDGTTFSPLYSKQSDGSGIYSFIDPRPVKGSNTYRLQQDNIGGAISMSREITIIYNPTGSTGLVSVYPNPTKATISISVATITTGTPAYKANIYNSAGRLMMQRAVSSNNWTEDVTQYTPGIYIIQLKDNNGSLIGENKFLKIN